MISALKSLIQQIETLTQNEMTISTAIDEIENNMNCYEDLLLINVLRESLEELTLEEIYQLTA